MTVGIAAICRTSSLGDTVICVADTKFSHGFTSSGRHFKFQTFGPKWQAALAANDLQHAEDLLDEINRLLFASPHSKDSVHDLKDILDTARDTVRKRIGAQSLPSGLSLDEFLANGKSMLPDWAYTEIWNTLKRTRLQCELLVFGVDKEKSVHLLSVGEDIARSHDRESFYAIGSGAVIASAILSACDQSDYDDWRLTAYRMFSAKKCSERAEGVGEETLMTFATADGLWTVYHEALQSLYDKYGPLPAPGQQKALVTELGTLTLMKDDPALDWRPSKPTSQAGAVPIPIASLVPEVK